MISQCSESHNLPNEYKQNLAHIHIIRPIWIKFGAEDVHCNIVSYTNYCQKLAQ
jgi:hypothetical protein